MSQDAATPADTDGNRNDIHETETMTHTDSEELTSDEIRAIVADELDRQVEAAQEQTGYSRRQILSALVGGGLATAILTAGASEEAAAVPDGNIGEPGSPLIAVYTEAIKDTNDATLINLPSGGPIDLQVELSLYKVTSDPGSPAVGEMWYREDLD